MNTFSPPSVSADQFREAALQKIASTGRNHHMVKMAFGSELEKIAWRGAAGRFTSWVGRGLSSVGAKRLGASAQETGGMMMLRRAKQLEQSAKNMAGAAAPSSVRKAYSTEYAGKAGDLKSRAGKTLNQAQRDFASLAVGQKGTYAGRRAADDARRVRDVRRDVLGMGSGRAKLAPPKKAPKGETPPPTPKSTPKTEGTAGRPIPVGPPTKPQDSSTFLRRNFGWGNARARGVSEDATAGQRAGMWWRGLTPTQQRNNVLAGMSGAAAAGTGAGLAVGAGSKKKNNRGQETVSYG